jgi:hypothetical protein
MNYDFVDIAVFAIANFLNLMLAAMFVARARGMNLLERWTGLATLVLIIPVGAATIINLAGGREWWSVFFPALLFLFLLIELILDYILELEFKNTKLLWPYLLIYYLAMMGMIGYTFGVSELFGFITLGTYFVNLWATWYSYSRVGHGPSVA